MARVKVGARVRRTGGEWTDTEPVYGVVRDLRGYNDGGAVTESYLVRSNDDEHEEWLPWTHLEEVVGNDPR